MTTQNHRYPSKKGFVIYIPVIIMIGVCALGIINGEYFSALFCTVLVLLIVAPMILNTNYTISADNTLRVRCGFFVNLLIEIDKVRKIEFTRSVLSSPALSMDRIEIFYNKFDSVIVSPENKLEFIAELISLNPDIEVKGNAK